jgi:hypothetical protein
MAYVRERRAALEVYLSDPEVPIDTNSDHADIGMKVVGLNRWRGRG